jgi:mRNA interferase MazF
MSTGVDPLRGDVWVVDLDPTRGHEQGGNRPALVISTDTLNQGPAGLVIALPITSKAKRVRSHVEVDPPEAGLTLKSYIKCEDIRSLDKQRFSRHLGAVSPQTLATVEYCLRILLDL